MNWTGWVVNWLHFVSLIYRKQFKKYDLTKPMGCELTTFRIFDISQTVGRVFWLVYLDVVNWLHFVSLIYRKQCMSGALSLLKRCELTTFLYLWYIANSRLSNLIFKIVVVNWLHFVSLIYRKQCKGVVEKWKVGCELTTFRIFDISQTVNK